LSLTKALWEAKVICSNVTRTEMRAGGDANIEAFNTDVFDQARSGRTLDKEETSATGWSRRE